MKYKGLLKVFGLAALGAYIYVRFIEPNWLHVSHHTLRLPRLPKAFDHYRLVQISDIHLGSWMNQRRLQEVVEVVNLIEPDLIAITGDFVDRHSGVVADDLIAPLRRMQARDGVVAVMGNHDYSNGIRGVRRALRAAGVIELSNQVHVLRRGDAALHIAGVDDVVFHQDCLDAALDQLPPYAAAVLLIHEPDFADLSAPTGRFDLQLSGHTHGGQVNLPGVGALVLPSYGKRYAGGLYQVDGMQLYVSNGVGSIFPHVRFNVRPEVSVLTLQSSTPTSN